MAKNNTSIFRKRFDFSKIPATIQIPNLIEVQKSSYERFLQMDSLPRSATTPACKRYFNRYFRFPISATFPTRVHQFLHR